MSIRNGKHKLREPVVEKKVGIQVEVGESTEMRGREGDTKQTSAYVFCNPAAVKVL
jgi:hypothetical protein